jgi:hypothetical protein
MAAIKRRRFLSEVHLFLRYVRVHIHSEASPTDPRPQSRAFSRYIAGFALSRPRCAWRAYAPSVREREPTAPDHKLAVYRHRLGDVRHWLGNSVRRRSPRRFSISWALLARSISERPSLSKRVTGEHRQAQEPCGRG